MEEGEGEGGDICCTPDVQESICQGISALVMGLTRGFSSYDEAQLLGWIWNDLFSTWSSSLLAFDRNRLERSLGLTSFSFLAASMKQ